LAEIPITIGYPTADVRLAQESVGNPLQVPEGLIYHDFRVHYRPTALSLFPGTVETAWAKPLRSVGKFIVSHPYEKDGFRFEFRSGAGDTNNALFEIRGDELYAVNQLTAGYKFIRVRVRDRFTYSIDVPLVLGVSVSAPTDIAIANSSLEVDGETTGVGTLTTTDADVGDVFVYTIVAGAGDTDNALFTIAGDNLDELHFAEAPIVTGTYSVRIRSTDAGGSYFEEAFPILAVDTVAPVMDTFLIPATGTSYGVIPTSGIATDAVGATHFMITEDNVAPTDPDDVGWVAAGAFDATTYTIQGQLGSGDYTLYCWAKDAAGNISLTSESATITLTI